MEEPSEDHWEIQEYSSEEERNSKVSWILKKGLSLGRKIVITGIVISSAPLVLPSLVVVSALGFAFSVPFGLVFASYACTEKLMSKLLPRGTSAPMLENGTVSEDEKEEDEDVMEEDVEEKMKEWAKMRNALVEEGRYEEVLKEKDENWPKGDENDDQEPVEEVYECVKEGGYKEDDPEYLDTTADYYEHKITEKDVEEPRNVVDENVKEEDYEVGFREYLVGNDHEGTLEGLEVEIEGMGEVEAEEPAMARIMGEQPLEENQEMHQVVVEKNGIEVSVELDLERRGIERRGDKNMNSWIEEEDLARETTGLIEKLRDENDVGNPVEKDDLQRKEICENGEGKDEKNFTHAEEMEKQFKDESVDSEKLVGEMKGAEGERRNEGPEQNKEIQEGRTKENADAGSREVERVVEMGGIIEGNRDEKNFNNVVVAEKTIGDLNGSINGNRLGKVVEIIEEQRPAANKKAVMQGGGTKNRSVSVVHDGFQLEREKKFAVHSSADAREISDESGFDSIDDRKGGGDNYSYTVYEKFVDEYDNTLDRTTQKNAGFMELRVSLEEPELEHAGIASEMDTALPDSKVLLCEEKIWEHIEALRTIVGYKVARHATCVEELQALYIFTGVEPPASFKKPSDLVEVNDKLQFLMSIVGVK